MDGHSAIHPVSLPDRYPSGLFAAIICNDLIKVCADGSARSMGIIVLSLPFPFPSPSPFPVISLTAVRSDRLSPLSSKPFLAFPANSLKPSAFLFGPAYARHSINRLPAAARRRCSVSMLPAFL